MSDLARRLRAERDLWNGVWRQIDAFLDRIESAANDDGPQAKIMCALLPVFNVIEAARLRSIGYRLDAALPAVPGGVSDGGQLVGSYNETTLTSAACRIPGVEDCEFAVAGYSITDGKIDDTPKALMSRSIALSKFRDEKHGLVLLRAPSYDFGDLTGKSMVVLEIGDGGLFPQDQRQCAIDGDPFTFSSWQDLRDGRLPAALAAAKQAGGNAGQSLSMRFAQLISLPDYPQSSALLPFGNEARNDAQGCRDDAATLDAAKTTLSEAGVSDEVIGAIANATATLQQQAVDFDWAAAELSWPKVNGLGPDDLQAVVGRLQAAEGGFGVLGLPASVQTLDAAAAKAMHEAVQRRIGYPDGPLRQLRMLEWALRFFWQHRTTWMKWRDQLVLTPIFAAYMGTFTDSLDRVLRGQASGILLPNNTLVGRETLVGATELPLSNLPDLSSLQAGQIVVVLGDRPTAAPVLGALYDGKKLPPVRLKVPALTVSVATGKDLPGVPGLISLATPLGDHCRPLSDDEVRRGANREGAAGDALVQALVAQRSRLALVLGTKGSTGRPAPPAIAMPYPGIYRFDLEGTISSDDSRLFLKTMPGAVASGTGEQLPIARPGEFMLLYGQGSDGYPWQTAIEVDHVVITAGPEAKKDEAAGDTPVPPPCCAQDDQPVMVVYLRSMPLPTDVQLTDAFLHRSFAGFGPRSLLTGVMLPEDLDPETSSVVQVGSQTLQPRRDYELRAAVQVFDQWMPKETS
jgi:hypothetical protein